MTLTARCNGCGTVLTKPKTCYLCGSDDLKNVLFKDIEQVKKQNSKLRYELDQVIGCLHDYCEEYGHDVYKIVPPATLISADELLRKTGYGF